MDEEWAFQTLLRNLELGAKLQEFWNEETLCFRREVPETGKAIGLIPQMFNIMVTVADIDDFFGYKDGY
jgi:hypothetical protein